ncbi:MAG: XRE family transcriptional regulator [Wenzhouxiangellaceae bacterium]
MEQTFQPIRLKQARYLKRFTLEDLAERVGVSRQSINFFELGERTPAPTTLRRIADALEMPIRFFSKSVGTIESSRRSVVQYRSLERERRKAKERQRSSTLMDLGAAVVDVLNRYVEFEPAKLPDLFDLNDDSLEIEFEDIETAAVELRRYWGLGEGPISDLTLLIENNSIPVISTKLADGMEGLSAWYGSRPFILTSSAANYYRARMNVAHELGHLVLHRGVHEDMMEDSTSFKTIEAQAWRFAGALLMPATSFLSELYSISLDSLLILKKRWGVSVAAMVSRLKDLEVINDSKRSYLMAQLNQRKWRKSEPGDKDRQVESSQLLNHAARFLDESCVIRTEDLARQTCLPTWFLMDILTLTRGELEGSVENSNVISFRMRDAMV